MSDNRACAAVVPTPGPRAEPCTGRVVTGTPYCSEHLGPLDDRPTGSTAEFFQRWTEDVRAAVTDPPEAGDHDPALVRALLPFALPLYSLYWRVEVRGIEHIPASGPGLLVANHSGTVPIDAAMLKIAVLREHGRSPWLLAGDMAFAFPGLRELIRRTGNARADRAETVGLMRRGELLGVFPEGYKGIGKGWRKRYQLQRFGRGGFVEVCLETGAPIIPVAIIGAEEAYPMVANVRSLARRLGIPYFPITPTFPLLGPLGAIPLPSKWIIAFGEPITMIEHGRKAVDDWQLVLETTERVRTAVQDLVDQTLPERGSMFR